MATATWVREELNQHGIAFQELERPKHHRPAGRPAQHVSGHCVAKVVCVMADGRPVEVVLPAARRLQLNSVRHSLGAHDALATEDELQQYFTECEVGAIPALHHSRNIDIIMDESLRTSGDILIQAGTFAMRFA